MSTIDGTLYDIAVVVLSFVAGMAQGAVFGYVFCQARADRRACDGDC